MTKTSVLLAAENQVIPLNEVWVASDTGLAKRGNGTTAYNSLPYWQPGVCYAHTKADQSSSDGTNLANVLGLSFPVEAGGTYAFEFNLIHHAAATTTGLVLAINGPADPTYVKLTEMYCISATAPLYAGVSAYESAMGNTFSSATAASPFPTLLAGYLVNGVNAGTLTLRYRTEVNASAVTIQRGSWGRLTRIG